ncbi:UDP-glycosyltransferase 83A1-like [Quercus lobata]|uniref:UDP-glycosyltransferase 83A1-like n=1 Tax=Quercus lobata TaxID=97700 RepID=UPI00124617C8|nr:UDP-glycosyltransferase 83A1-like [Quercus lobata]
MEIHVPSNVPMESTPFKGMEFEEDENAYDFYNEYGRKAAQGHVAPLMKLSHQIANQGIKVTFVSTEFIIARLTTTMPVNSLIRLVSLPDGLEPGDDRTDALKLINIFQEVMPGHFKDLIEKSNESYDDQISCVIAGISVVWAFED